MSTFDLTKPADSSESEDDDYVPSESSERFSAEESEGDESDAENDAGSDAEVPAGKKRKAAKKRPSSRKRKGGIHLEGEDSVEHDSPNMKGDTEDPLSTLSPEDEKKKADLLWSDFLRDVEPIPKKRTVPSSSVVAEPSKPSSSSTNPQEVPMSEKKVKITQLLEFAGETIKVDKEVAADSKEARLFAQKEEEIGQTKLPVLPGKRKPVGAGNVLNQLFNKKQKMSTLEKSKLDWDNYKKSEGLVEDLQSHNKGKDGYLEKQAFLQRADVRQFEIEKNLRAKNRSSNYL